MKIEVDDEFADEIVVNTLKEVYVSMLVNKEEYVYPEDLAMWEDVITHIPPVLKYFMHEGAFDEFMQRVQEMKEND